MNHIPGEARLQRITAQRAQAGGDSECGQIKGKDFQGMTIAGVLSANVRLVKHIAINLFK